MKLRYLVSALCLAAASLGAHAQDAYPDHPVRIVVNVTPGGGVDAAARLIADKLSKKFGKPFIIENRAGAAGNLAADFVSRSEPDGYTLLAAYGATNSINDLLFKNLGYDPLALKPIALMTSVPLALIVRPDFPANNFREFVAYAKANPNKINYASNGVGTAAHLTGEMFKLEAGVEMSHVPYKGTAPVATDLIASHVDATFIQYSAFYDLYKAGRVKILAIAAQTRVETLPEVPTMAEMGFPGIVSETWNMLSAPPKTPPALVARLNSAVEEALQMPDVKEKFRALHTSVEGGSPEAVEKYVQLDRARWKKVIDAAGIKPE